MNRATVFSPCRKYRYTLWREWQGGSGYLMVIGLNPSTADEVQDDPTIRRCIRYAKDWGFGGLCMTNLFAYRATNPRDMKGQKDPIGPDNNRWLVECAEGAALILAAWGADGDHEGRGFEVRGSLPAFCRRKVEFHHLGLTKHGQPKHPLYLAANLKPIPWKSL